MRQTLVHPWTRHMEAGHERKSIVFCFNLVRFCRALPFFTVKAIEIENHKPETKKLSSLCGGGTWKSMQIGVESAMEIAVPCAMWIAVEIGSMIGDATGYKRSCIRKVCMNVCKRRYTFLADVIVFVLLSQSIGQCEQTITDAKVTYVDFCLHAHRARVNMK